MSEAPSSVVPRTHRGVEMDETRDRTWDGACDDAWRRFRGRLADALADLAAREPLVVELEVDDADGLDGAVPYVQFLRHGDDALRAEAVSNAYLDERYELTPEQEELLRDHGWFGPADDEGENFHVDVALREVDRVAAMAVAALREVHGCAHPLLLDAEGLERDEGWSEPGPQAEAEQVEQPMVRVRDRDHLQRLVDLALQRMFDKPLVHDEDGDLPIVCGSTVVWVRVLEECPAVEVFSFLAVDVEPGSHVLAAVNDLNRRWGSAQFSHHEDRVEMRFGLPAQPFVAAHLREVVGSLCDQVDDIAVDLVARVGGRRFADQSPPEPPGPPGVDEASLPLLGLLELLVADGEVPTSRVAGLFDDDRLAIIRELVLVRTGRQSVGGLHEDLVLDHLRAALRHVVDGRDERGEGAALADRIAQARRRRAPGRPEGRTPPTRVDSDGR